MTEVDAAEGEYEQAEAAYLQGLRVEADRPTMKSLAEAVAILADVWNAAAYRAFHASDSSERDALDATTERTEVLRELWADVRRAYGA